MATPVRVNAHDYDGAIVVEARSWWNGGELDWAVPAWEEMGFGELEGHFQSREDAETALSTAERWFPEYGYVRAPSAA